MCTRRRNEKNKINICIEYLKTTQLFNKKHGCSKTRNVAVLHLPSYSDIMFDHVGLSVDVNMGPLLNV